MYLPKQGDFTEDVDTPMLLLIPAGLVQWLLIAQRSPCDLHKKIMEVINGAGIVNVPDKMKMSLGWCLKAGQIASGDAGLNTFDPTGVFIHDPVTIAWLKQRLNTTIGIEVAPL